MTKCNRRIHAARGGGKGDGVSPVLILGQDRGLATVHSDQSVKKALRGAAYAFPRGTSAPFHIDRSNTGTHHATRQDPPLEGQRGAAQFWFLVLWPVTNRDQPPNGPWLSGGFGRQAGLQSAASAGGFEIGYLPFVVAISRGAEWRDLASGCRPTPVRMSGAHGIALAHIRRGKVC